MRSDHFHSGIDIKTQGVTGKKVYSVDDGYVSRIKIQTQGYGNSIYISHPGGITSVYGHLDAYNDTIAAYVRKYQYQKKTHTLDIYPDRDQFKVKKGDLIAYSGNSGGSAGPHLHFELRGSANQHPLNALLYNFDIKDNLPPRLYNLYIYPISETQEGKYAVPKVISLQKANGSYHLNTTDTLILKGSIGFGLEASDFLNDVNNSCGIYSIELKLNDEAVYLFRMDEFSFSESGYISAHSDYHALEEKNKKIHLLYLKPNNRLSLYPHILNNGLVSFEPGKTSKINIRVTDAYNNISDLEFYVKGSAPAVMSEKYDNDSFTLFKWDTPNYFENAQFVLSIPAGSLYEDYLFSYSRTEPGIKSFYPYIHYIGDRFTPLGKAAELSFSTSLIPENLWRKTLVAEFDANNKISCLNTSFKGDRITAKIKNLGKYTLVADTIAPSIIPVNIKPGANMKSQPSMRFVVKDELSGVSEYQGFIDNNWVLFEYDPKNDLIVYTFDSERLDSGKEHELELYIKDGVGNLKLYHTRFIW